MAKCNVLWWFINFVVILCNVHCAMGQEESACFGSGAIVTSVILTLVIGAAVAVLGYLVWKKYWKARQGKHLILETDPEKGKGEYAFDNPGFKDAGLTPVNKSLETSKLENGSKSKWNQWSPLGVLTLKNEKKRTVDDSAIDGHQKIVSLRSHDFTGLGFSICGSMKDGIFIKDVLHRGPAIESGKLNAGDRINSVTISFEHMVYEDALAILSYASPYEVIISAKSGKGFNYPAQFGTPGHPIYRSSSSADLTQTEKPTKKRLFHTEDTNDIGSNHSSLQKNRSNATTLERTKSKSPKPNQKPIKPKTKLSPDQLKSQLEQNIVEDYKETMRMKNDMDQPKVQEAETQKSDNKYQKFGIQVLPMVGDNKLQKSPKSAELSQNDNNINLEKTAMAPVLSIDEVDKKVAPPVKKREKINKPADPPKIEEINPENTTLFDRANILNGSGIKRDENNIPLEIPNTMFNAALAARKNRKSAIEEEDTKSPKKTKGKAPSPPEATRDKFDEIYPAEETEKTIKPTIKSNNVEEDDDDATKIDMQTELKDYNSDSDIETDNQSSVNTIELNASDITIHQSEENEEKQNRKTASTGDLSKIQKTRKPSTGTLERAQSLDITDTTMPTLMTKKRKAGKIEDNFDSKTSSDDSLYGKVLMNKEPRLSLILDGLNTFQRSRLKKSTEWGNLEDAILNMDKPDDSVESLERHSSSFEDFKLSSTENLNKSFNFGAKSPEFDALVNKINEIKQETIEIINEQERTIEMDIASEDVKEIISDVPGTMETMSKTIEEMPKSIEPVMVESEKVSNQIWPFNKNVETSEDEINTNNVITDVTIMNSKVELNDITLDPSTEKVIAELKQSRPIVDVSYKPTITNKIVKAEAPNLAQVNNFILAEREASSKVLQMDDTNVPDDIKVSRHSLGSLERPKFTPVVENLNNISNITISDKDVTPVSFEIKNDYNKDDSSFKSYDNIIVSTPDLIKNITIAEAIHDLNNEVTVEGPTSLTFEIPANKTEETKIVSKKIEVDEFKGHNGWVMKANGDINKLEVTGEAEKNNSSLTYITEIQVITPNNNKNISEIEIIPKVETTNKNLDNDFENYIKNFESNIKNFENNIHTFEQTINDVTETATKEPTKSIIITESVDAEKELLKVQEIVEEQLKKLPEMRFTTSSYESQIKPPEKRQASQIEILRSNFEKSSSPPRMARSETSPPKSRIPVLNKTPPTSPERRDSRNLENEHDKEILEMMSSQMTTSLKYQPPKTPTRNVTVTSIRTNSKIPSGLPTYSSRPPVPPRKSETHDDHLVQISTNGNTTTESSFRQWVFNPSDSAVTNITVTDTKYDNK